MAVTVNLHDDGRSDAIFPDGVSAFGVFVGQASTESCWELLTGPKTGVLALADQFQNRYT